MAEAQTQLVPFSELTSGQAGAIRNDVIRRLLSIAVRELKVGVDNLVVRDIRAKEDLILYSKGAAVDVEDWGCVTGTTADAYETMAADTMATDRWMAFFGVTVNPDCPCTALKFHVGGGDRVIWQLQALREDDDFTGLCPSGVVIPQSIPYTISRFVRVASSPAVIILKGIVVERRGKVVSP